MFCVAQETGFCEERGKTIPSCSSVVVAAAAELIPKLLIVGAEGKDRRAITGSSHHTRALERFIERRKVKRQQKHCAQTYSRRDSLIGV